MPTTLYYDTFPEPAGNQAQGMLRAFTPTEHLNPAALAGSVGVPRRRVIEPTLQRAAATHSALQGKGSFFDEMVLIDVEHLPDWNLFLRERGDTVQRGGTRARVRNTAWRAGKFLQTLQQLSPDYQLGTYGIMAQQIFWDQVIAGRTPWAQYIEQHRIYCDALSRWNKPSSTDPVVAWAGHDFYLFKQFQDAWTQQKWNDFVRAHLVAWRSLMPRVTGLVVYIQPQYHPASTDPHQYVNRTTWQRMLSAIQSQTAALNETVRVVLWGLLITEVPFVPEPSWDNFENADLLDDLRASFGIVV